MAGAKKLNQSQSEQSGSSSSEADMFGALIDKSYRTGEGWNDDFFQAMMKTDNEMEKNPESAFEAFEEAFERPVQEHKQSAKTQQAKAVQEAERRRREEDVIRWKEQQRQVMAEKEEAA